MKIVVDGVEVLLYSIIVLPPRHTNPDEHMAVASSVIRFAYLYAGQLIISGELYNIRLKGGRSSCSNGMLRCCVCLSMLHGQYFFV